MDFRRTSALAFAMVAATGTAHAQVDWSDIIGTVAQEDAIMDAAREGRGGPGGAQGATVLPRRDLGQALSRTFAAQTTASPSPSAPVISASYTPSTEAREKLAAIMGEAAARNGVAQGKEMRQLVLSRQALSEYERVAPAVGLKANDAIDAYAFYMLTQWGVANDYRANFTRAQVAGVRRQAANAFAGVADQLATDALRQEFAEMLAIQGVIMSGAHEAAVRKGDEAAAAKYVAVARRGGQKVFTMDPTTMVLTDAGFRKKR
ncbi:DUF6683 family protein [Novosphingobium sp. RD2P27]|uniref:DUF6683 family protein n=1 Tax=Novosphingobium kalidii TaxID=3230299 RepID=A0ABV2D1U3_9SPHN